MFKEIFGFIWGFHGFCGSVGFTGCADSVGRVGPTGLVGSTGSTGPMGSLGSMGFLGPVRFISPVVSATSSLIIIWECFAHFGEMRECFKLWCRRQCVLRMNFWKCAMREGEDSMGSRMFYEFSMSSLDSFEDSRDSVVLYFYMLCRFCWSLGSYRSCWSHRLHKSNGFFGFYGSIGSMGSVCSISSAGSAPRFRIGRGERFAQCFRWNARVLQVQESIEDDTGEASLSTNDC